MAKKVTNLDLLAKGMTEKELQESVTHLATVLGYLTYHTLPAQRQSGNWLTPVTSKGFPDLLILGKGRLVVAELKSATGILRPEQTKWLGAFRDAGIETYVWRPKDWLSRDIERVLRKSD